MINKDWKIKQPENANITAMLSRSPDYFQKRLEKIGFTGSKTKFLDAGCGGGHFAAVASYLNKEVYGIDATEKYLTVAKDVQKNLKIEISKQYKRLKKLFQEYLRS